MLMAHNKLLAYRLRCVTVLCNGFGCSGDNDEDQSKVHKWSESGDILAVGHGGRETYL